ncbi:MAG: hypothetical protein K0S65_6163 [Labilithrix sp.]|nr:hypothetical protein [Labilithrix sp.]
MQSRADAQAGSWPGPDRAWPSPRGYGQRYDALGKATRTDAVDWVIHQRDGGTLGGESNKVLQARAPK